MTLEDAGTRGSGCGHAFWKGTLKLQVSLEHTDTAVEDPHSEEQTDIGT